MTQSLPQRLASLAFSAVKASGQEGSEVQPSWDSLSKEVKDLIEELTPFQTKILRIIVKTLKNQEVSSIIQYVDQDFPLELPKKDLDAIKSAFSKIANHARVQSELSRLYAPESNLIAARTLRDLRPGDSLQVVNEDKSVDDVLVFKKDEGAGGEFLTITPRNGGTELNSTIKMHDRDFLTRVNTIKRPSIRSILSFARKAEWGSAILQPMFDIQYPLRALAQSEDVEEALDCEDLDLLIDGAMGNHGLGDKEKSRKWHLVTLLFLAKNKGIKAENKEKRIEEAFRLIDNTEPEVLQELPQVRKFIQKP